VLDVGCGTGSLALILDEHREAGQVAGVDIAAPYIAFARSRSGVGGVGFAVGDACRLPYADGSFAAALAQLSLNFVPDAARDVKGRRRRCGGLGFSRRSRLPASVLGHCRGCRPGRRRRSRPSVLDPARPVRRSPSALCRDAGLTGVERSSLTIRMEYADFSDYWEPLLGGHRPVGAYIEGLSPKRRRLIEERIRAAFLPGAPDGPRSLTATA